MVGVWQGRFCHSPVLLVVHTSKGTFLSLAAPVPERMASIKACLASMGLLWGPELDLAAVLDAGGAGAAGGDGGGSAGGDWLLRSSSPGASVLRAELAASRKLRSSSEAQDATLRRLQAPRCPRMAASRAECSLSASTQDSFLGPPSVLGSAVLRSLSLPPAAWMASIRALCRDVSLGAGLCTTGLNFFFGPKMLGGGVLSGS